MGFGFDLIRVDLIEIGLIELGLGVDREELFWLLVLFDWFVMIEVIVGLCILFLYCCLFKVLVIWLDLLGLWIILNWYFCIFIV